MSLDRRARRAVAVAITFALFALLVLAGCESLADWAAEPATPSPAPDPLPASDAPPAGGDPAPSPPAGATRGDVIVETAAGLLGSANPFLGYGVLAAGRLGLGWLSRFRSK